MKLSFSHNFKQTLIILLASFLTAFSVEVFLLSQNIIVGGLLGVASVLDLLLAGFDSSKWYFDIGIWVFVLNIPICIHSFLHFRSRFAVKTTLYLVFLSVELVALRLFNVSSLINNLVGETDKVVFLLIGGALQGLSLPLMLSVNASTGGSDVLGLAVQKKDKISGSQAMRLILFINIAVVVVGSVVYGIVKNNVADAINMVIYSIATMFIGEVVQEIVFGGFSSALEMEITTTKPEEVSQALSENLKHGTTILKVTGGYSNEQKSVVVCVINNRQLIHARSIINEVDPNAFAYVEKVKEVIGKGFQNKEQEMENK